MDALRQTELVDASLQSSFQEILHLESQHVIELHPVLVQNPDTDQSANEGIAFEQPLGIFLV